MKVLDSHDSVDGGGPRSLGQIGAACSNLSTMRWLGMVSWPGCRVLIPVRHSDEPEGRMKLDVGACSSSEWNCLRISHDLQQTIESVGHLLSLPNRNGSSPRHCQPRASEMERIRVSAFPVSPHQLDDLGMRSASPRLSALPGEGHMLPPERRGI